LGFTNPLDQSVEYLSNVFALSPIVPEGVFIEVKLKVFPTDGSMMSAEKPSLHKRNGSMGVGKKVFIGPLSSLCDSNFMSEPVGLQWPIARPAIGDYGGS
jgi:hypothetical protein